MRRILALSLGPKGLKGIQLDELIKSDWAKSTELLLDGCMRFKEAGQLVGCWQLRCMFILIAKRTFAVDSLVTRLCVTKL